MSVSIATVSLSGSLEQKLRAAARAGFDAVEIFEPDLVASPLSARRDPQPGRRARPGDSDVPAPEGLRGGRRRDARAQPAPGAPQVRAHERARAPTRCSSAPTSRRTPSTIPSWRPRSCTGWPRRPPSTASASPTRRSRWGAHVNDYRDAWRIVELADHPSLGTCIDSFHILSRGRRPGRHPRHPRREDLLPPARRRPADRDARAPVEPPLPLLPRPGGLRPRRRSWSTSRPPATADRGRSRSSTTSSVRRIPTASPWTPGAR